MRNIKLNTILSISLISLSSFATDYDDAQFDNFVDGQGVNTVLNDAQFILCSLARFGTESLAGDGTYKATIYSDECEGQGNAAASDSSKGTTAPTSANSSSSSTSSSSSGTSAATSTNKKVDTVIVNSGFVSETQQDTKAWIIDEAPFNPQDNMPKNITYILNKQTAAASDTNKFGNFTMRYQSGTYGNKQSDFADDYGGFYYECPAETSNNYQYSWCADGADLGRGILVADNKTIKFKTEGQTGQDNVVAEYSSNGDIAGIYTKNEGFQDDSLRDTRCDDPTYVDDNHAGDWWECQPEVFRQSSTEVLGVFAFAISNTDQSYCTKMQTLYKVDWSNYDEETQGPTLTDYTLTGSAGERLQSQGWDVAEKCFSIAKSDAIKDIWDYGVYNSDGSKYYAENQSFPIRAEVTIDEVKRNAHGYASYWGVHVDENYLEYVDDNTEWLKEDDNSETPTIYNVTGKKLVVEKREKKFEALDDLDGLNLNFWTNDSWWSEEFYKLGFAKTEPWDGAIKFDSNKAVFTDYNNGNASEPMTHHMYGQHDGNSTYVANLRANIDTDNLRKIIKNDASDPGKAMNLSMKFQDFPRWQGYQPQEFVVIFLCNGDISSKTGFPTNFDNLNIASNAQCLRVSGQLLLDSEDGQSMILSSKANEGYDASYYDSGDGTTINFGYDRWNNGGNEYELKITRDGIERPSGMELRLQALFNKFGNVSQFDGDGGNISSGLEAFLDSSSDFTFMIASWMNMYDHLGNKFNKVKGSFSHSSAVENYAYVDDVFVVEGTTVTTATGSSALDDKDVAFSVTTSLSTGCSFDWALDIANSTARSDDYANIATSGTVSIPSGSSTATIPLTIIGDSVSEGFIDETIKLTLSAGTGCSVDTTRPAVAYIEDNDTNQVVYEDYIGSYNAATKTFTVTDGMTFYPSYSRTTLDTPITFTTTEWLDAMQKVYGEGEEWEYTEYRDLNIWSQDTNQNYTITKNSFENPSSNSTVNGISTEKWSRVSLSDLPSKLNCIRECLKTSLVKSHYADVKSQADPGGDNSYSGSVTSTSTYPFADVGPYYKTTSTRELTRNAGTPDEYKETLEWTRGQYVDGILADDVYSYTVSAGVLSDASGDELEIGVDWGISYPTDNIQGAGFNMLDPNNTWKYETAWGISTGTLVDDTNLARLECDYSVDSDGNKTYNQEHHVLDYESGYGTSATKTRYCAEKLWSSKEILVSYSVRLETQRQFEIKQSDGNAVEFAEPKILYFDAPNTAEFGDDAGKKFRLELNGDWLGGIPGSVVDIDTGEDKGEYVTEWKDSYRWVQRFTIPDGSVLTQNTSSDTYLVKALGGQEWLGKKDSAIGTLATLLSSKNKDDLLTNVDLDFEIMNREVAYWDCSIKMTRTDDNGYTFEETDWNACNDVAPDDPSFNDIWTKTRTFENCRLWLQDEFDRFVDEITRQKNEAAANGYTYEGPNSPFDEPSFKEWWDRENARCMTIGVLPTSMINGGNASVVNGTVVYDPTP